MNSKNIREEFLSFFKKKEHKIVSSAPIVVKDDPTLMFTNAGMNQFKDYFLGNRQAEHPRVTDTQKCLRVSGKHNDLEEVGMDTYHHTMFEMLGNWSFGNYFKKEAIAWAWELLTKVYGLDQQRLYATVFEGDEIEKLAGDEEARKLWQNFLPNDRILNGSKKDNFWEMGDSGPCGPCSEIHIDLRPEQEVLKLPGHELVNQDHPQVVEIWNLVFIQFNRLSSGQLENLPNTHVDTGLGFERLVMAIQGKTSNYDTDVFQPIIQKVAANAGINYGDNEKTDIALRVISDHVRAISFTIADGQLPGNVKAGYVIRRILRRAVRYGYTFLNFQEPFLCELVPLLADQFDDVFPELKQQEEFVMKVIREEEISFLRTLDKGLKRLDDIRKSASGNIDGKAVFELYDTYGFPLDLTALIARENKINVDEKGFHAEMAIQKERSKNAAKLDTEDWIEVSEGTASSQFIGYEELVSESRLLRYREVRQKKDIYYQLVLDKTPFYAESGGQVGDAGWLDNGSESIEIFDTKKENDLIIHFTKALPKKLTSHVIARVDQNKRKLTQNNHSATHLLHAALRETLGDHVQQKGSLVNDTILRFDFSHFTRMTTEEIRNVEDRVNAKIRENIRLDEKRNVPINTAKEMGATALFGEKYGEFVRVITFDPEYSVELCGGTHVSQTGQIGFFKIMSEGSVAAGVRRVEAITGDRSQNYVLTQLDELSEVNHLLKTSQNTASLVAKLIEEKNSLQKQIDQLNQEKSKSVKSNMIESLLELGQVKLIRYKGTFPDNEVIKQLAFELKREIPKLALLIGAEINGKPSLAVMFDEVVQKEFGLDASKMVRDMSKHIKGGGGGQPFFATAGGKEVSGLDEALKAGITILEEKIGISIS